MPKTLLEKLETLLEGPVTAYDGQYIVWYKTTHPYMVRGNVDLRDVVKKIRGATLEGLVEALPSFDKPKRAKAAMPETEEE